MKRLLTLSLAVLLTSPLIAATKTPRKYKTGSEARVLPSDPGRLSRLMARHVGARRGPGASVIGDARSARLLVFPAAGSVRGAGGEFFRSDVTLANFNSADQQRLIAIWLQNNVETDDPPAFEITLDENSYHSYDDFVGTVLNRENQLGSILILPIDDAGEIEFADTAIDGFSRIWTNQPNATGTVAQPFEAVDPTSWYVFETASVMGLRHDNQYRSNFGLVNIDDIPLTFTVNFLGEGAQNQQTITVPAGGMTHRAVPAGNYGRLVIEVTVSNPEALWVAYGTSNDNITGDGWVSIGSGLMTPADLDDIDGGF
jgi:hypothetical protein